MRVLMSFAAAILFASPSAFSQTIFPCPLNGGQESPPTASLATGSGLVAFDPASNTFRYDFTVAGLSGAPTAVEVAQGPPGVSGFKLFNLTGGPTKYFGTSPVLSAAQVTALLSSGLYVNVKTLAFATGEIRGQITPNTNRFSVFLTGGNLVPPVITPHTGSGVFELNESSKFLTGSLTFASFAGGDVAHIHEGLPGLAGPILATINPYSPFGQYSVSIGPLSDLTIAKLRAGELYVDIHDANFPTGEARGQIIGSFSQYGAGCPSSAGLAFLAGFGSMIPLDVNYAVALVSVFGGKPGGGGLLFVAPNGSLNSLSGNCALFVAPPIPLVIPLTLGANGAVTLSPTIPTTAPTPVWLQLQFFGLDPSLVSGYYATNGLTLHLHK